MEPQSFIQIINSCGKRLEELTKQSHRALGQNLKGPQAARESIAKARVDFFLAFLRAGEGMGGGVMND